MAQVLLDDEAQPHPAQDRHQRARRDGPDREPGQFHYFVAVGEMGRGYGKDVDHTPTPPRTRRLPPGPPAPPRRTKSRGLPGSPTWAPDLAQRSGSSAPSTLSHSPLGWWTGIRAWKTWWPPPARGTASASRKDSRGEGRAARPGPGTRRCTPTLGQPLLAALDPVGVGDPLAGVGVADGVVEDVGLAAEDGAGHEAALLLPLHHLPVAVDQADVVGGVGSGPGQRRSWGRRKGPPAAKLLPGASEAGPCRTWARNAGTWLPPVVRSGTGCSTTKSGDAAPVFPMPYKG